MFANFTKYLICTLFFCTTICQSQVVEASVFDEKTKEPLMGVSVYFDGTTNGTITNIDGMFRISYQTSTKSALVVSYLGYETKLFEIDQFENGSVIYLSEKVESLETVYLENDPWTRKKKLAIFKREFIGRSVAENDCKIVNEDDIQLVYNPTTQKLSAYASKPIILKNNYLGYLVSYTMEEFEVQLQVPSSGLVLTRSVYVEGTSFYTEQNKKLRRKHRKAREREYGQSVLYFMRSLAKKRLTENGFQIFHKGFIVPPYTYFEISQIGEDTKVNVLVNRLVIVYDRFQKSFLTILDENKEFVINKYGNYSPPRKIYFGGVLGDKRIGNTLPLDYSL